tara:strand:+ start:3277 stop:3996 length:720 start_codon:yes stop_codon:yes gene_type:complete
MNNNILNYLIIFVIISYLFYQDIKTGDQIEKIMNLEDLPKIINNSGLEITNLKKTSPILHFEYNTTFNHVVNDGRKVYINTLRALNNRLILDGHRYNLSSIEFHLGTSKFNNKKVHLELHLVNNSTVNDSIIRIIIPLSLVDVYENFKAVNSFNISVNNNHKNKQYIKILSPRDIPYYYCCSPNKGKLKRIDFNFINCFLNNSKNFYVYTPNSQNTWFYSTPKKFSKITGRKILESLQK